MKNHLIIGLIGLSTMGLMATDGTGTASVRLVKPLSIVKHADLFFGDYMLVNDPANVNTGIMMEAGGNGGADAFSIGGGAVIPYTGSKAVAGGPHTARFTILGEPGLLCQVQTPYLDLPLKNANGTGDLIVNAAPTGDFEWTTYPAADGSFSITLMSAANAGGLQNVPLDGSGFANFYVGGVLKIAAGQTVSGLYSAEFQVNVHYN